MSINLALLRSERRFEAALGAGDVSTLDRLLAADFVYTHTGGESNSRQQFLAGVAGRGSVRLRQLTEVVTELHGNVAVTRGELTIAYPTGRADHHVRYVRVYRRFDTRWLIISHRSFEAPDRAPATASVQSSNRP